MPKLPPLPAYPVLKEGKKPILENSKWKVPLTAGYQPDVSFWFIGYMNKTIGGDSYGRTMCSIEPMDIEDVKAANTFDKEFQKQFREIIPYLDGLRHAQKKGQSKKKQKKEESDSDDEVSKKPKNGDERGKLRK